MDFRTLKQFLALADTLHFGRASEICHISPPTLSRAIKSLEEQLGIVLFERDNRSVSLTEEGLKFQSYAREALSDWDTIRLSLMEDAKELKGELSFYCSVTASYSFLYDILSDFRQRYPRIEIKVHTGAPEQALGHVLSGTEDLVIAACPDTLPGSVAFHNIATSPLLFIAPKTQQLPATDEEWASVPMILSEEGIARQRVNQWFAEKHINPRIYAQVAGNEAIVSMVSLGFGVGIVPKIVLDNSPLSGQVTVLNVSPGLEPFNVGICTLEKNLKNPLVQAFWSQLT